MCGSLGSRILFDCTRVDADVDDDVAPVVDVGLLLLLLLLLF